jgi:hypothetical protein
MTRSRKPRDHPRQQRYLVCPTSQALPTLLVSEQSHVCATPQTRFCSCFLVSVTVQFVFLEIGWSRALRPGKQSKFVVCPQLLKTRIVSLHAIVLLILMALF